MQIHEIKNTTLHPITLVLRLDANRSNAIGTKEFIDRQIVLKPGVNTLTAEEAEAVDKLRRKAKTTRSRFERGELVKLTRNATRSGVEEKIRQCADVETLKRWRADNTDKALGELLEAQLAACTVTTDGDVTDHEVDRDPENPRKARKGPSGK